MSVDDSHQVVRRRGLPTYRVLSRVIAQTTPTAHFSWQAISSIRRSHQHGVDSGSSGTQTSRESRSPHVPLLEPGHDDVYEPIGTLR